jgi:hypothetical protein
MGQVILTVQLCQPVSSSYVTADASEYALFKSFLCILHR